MLYFLHFLKYICPRGFMSIQNYYELFYTMPTEELTELMMNSKSKEEKDFYLMIENYICKVQQEKVMNEEKEYYAK